MTSKAQKNIAVVGTGPAGLMVASVLTKAGYRVSLFEKRKGLGRKLLIAGSSGLNISSSVETSKLSGYYQPQGMLDQSLIEFPVAAWLEFIHNLGLKTFKGTSERYFVEEMTAASLVKKWAESLLTLGCETIYNRELKDFEVLPSKKIRLQFFESEDFEFEAVCFCLGGGSWEPSENPLRWPKIFQQKSIEFSEFVSSNCGFKVEWPEAFLNEAEGKPIKNVVLKSSKGVRAGELMVTSYGLEGTPIYSMGIEGKVFLDLKPDLTFEQIRQKLNSARENLSPIRRVKRFLNLSEAAMALVFHLTPKNISLDEMIAYLKNFPIHLSARQPLAEAISSSGGVKWSELNADLMLKKFTGVFLAGEMIDWDAPTGGFLIQACVSTGFKAAQGILKYV